MIDVEGNGVDRNDPTIASRTVWLDLDGDGLLDGDEPSTVTDARGAYAFAAAPAGSCAVRSAANALAGPAAASVVVFVGVASLSNVDLAAAALPTPGFARATLSGQVVQYVAGGNGTEPIRGWAGVRVFVDLNGDGVRGTDEPTAVSGGNGTYVVANVPAGIYEVIVETSGGWAPLGAVPRVTFGSGQQVEAFPQAQRTSSTLVASGMSFNGSIVSAWYRFDSDVSMTLGPNMLLSVGTSTVRYASRVRWDDATQTAFFDFVPTGPRSYAYLSWNGTVANSSYGYVLPMGFDTRVAGDVNGNGVVDFYDLLTLAQNYGRTGRTHAQGNLDDDPEGRVDFADLLILSQNYPEGAAAVLGVIAPAPAAVEQHKRLARIDKQEVAVWDA